MISYQRHILNNGLTLLIHHDGATPLATINLLYGVGARDEEPTLTGFAHLFEHLMFGGTKAVPDYDRVVNSLGGEANAFTNNDYTNFYITVPANQLETAIQLEADRMAGLDFSQKALKIQQRVVTEEYRQRYENQPYGDKWLLLRPLAYTYHPYRWCTIGADIKHVQQAKLENVVDFFNRYYRPDYAVLSVAGPVMPDLVVKWVQRYFGPITPSSTGKDVSKPLCKQRNYPIEPEPQTPRRKCVKRDVPANALAIAFLMSERHHIDFHAYDMLSDILSNGDSSRLHNNLVRGQALFTDLDAYITGDESTGLFVVSGKLNDGIEMEQAEKSIHAELRRIADEKIDDYEVTKVSNKYEATFAFSQYKAADRAQALCYYEWLGNAELINNEPQMYRQVNAEQLQRVAKHCFNPKRACVLEYRKQMNP